MLRVLATDHISSDGLALLRGVPNLVIDERPPLDRQVLIREIPNYHVVLVRSNTVLDRDVLERAEHLELIIRAGIGVDNIDVDYATQRGILVANTPRGNATTAAEHTMGLILALARFIPQAWVNVRSHKWDRKKFVGVELKGKILGLVGCGNIGAIVSKLSRGFGMQVMTYDPFITEELAKLVGAEKVSFDTLLAQADVISVHVPLTETTHHIINADAIQKMKPSALLINCARGGVVDEIALANALQERRIAGAAVDVFETEPPPPEHPLLALDNVVLTPHLGASTKEAQSSVSIDACELLREYAQHHFVSSAINSSMKLTGLSIRQRSFLVLAKKLGSLQGQLLSGVPTYITLEVSGPHLKEVREALLLSAAEAFFQHMFSQERINVVNVTWVAKQRQVSLAEMFVDMSSNSHGYTNVLRLRVGTKSDSVQECVVSGTVFDDDRLRITEIDGYEYDLPPEGNLLLVTNEDKPGVVGRIASLLGKHQVNISRMSVTLKKEGGPALAVYTLACALDSDLISEIASWEHILSCRYVVL